MKLNYRSFVMNAGLLAVSCLVGLVCVEIILRLTVYNFKNYATSPGPNSVYYIETSEFKTRIVTNSLNMRDHEIKPKQTGETRVLCLGDSFTFGLGVNVPEAYPKVAEAILKERGLSVSIINGGTQGNAIDAYEFLTKTGLVFKPDILVLQIFIGNDFYDCLRTLDTPKQRDLMQAYQNSQPSNKTVFGRFKDLLRGLHLRTPEFLWSCLIRWDWFDDFLFRSKLRYDNQGIYLKKYPELEAQLVSMELKALGDIRALCEKKGIRMVAVLAPAKPQVFKSRLLNNERFDYKKPNRTLKDYFHASGVPVIDLLDIYEAMPKERVRSFYFNQDQHWTVAGHAFLGKLLAQYLDERMIRRPAAVTAEN